MSKNINKQPKKSIRNQSNKGLQFKTINDKLCEYQNQNEKWQLALATQWYKIEDHQDLSSSIVKKNDFTIFIYDKVQLTSKIIIS